MMGLTVAITGGIGSGKSFVSNILRDLGYDVFDCDTEARLIMDSDSALKEAVDREVAPGCLNEDGSLDRRKIASVVFADKHRLLRLNSLVHTAVTQKLKAWLEERKDTAKPRFFETAILRASGLDTLADRLWEVTAPENIRVERVMKRSGLSADDVRARMEAQRGEAVDGASVIVNDGLHPVLPQVETLLQALNET